MEVKKSHKADLEHLRPWMFLGAFVIMALLFILVLEVHIGGRSDDFDDFDDDIAMDLNIKPNDQRDMIAAAEKTKQVMIIVIHPDQGKTWCQRHFYTSPRS